MEVSYPMGDHKIVPLENGRYRVQYETLSVEGEPGTNFGLRVDSETVVGLLLEWRNTGVKPPFDIMAAGYPAGESIDWTGLDPSDLDIQEPDWPAPAFVVLSGADWGPFELTVGPLREATEEDINDGVERGYVVKMTPEQSIDRLQRFMEMFYDASPAPRPELEEAVRVLADVVKHRNDSLTDLAEQSDDLQWGELGSCPDNKDDPEQRHYGVPHCIYCLQVM